MEEWLYPDHLEDYEMEWRVRPLGSHERKGKVDLLA